MNEQQFVQALLAQFSRGEGLNLITDPRESDSPVTSGGRRLYDLIDEAFSRLDIERLVEDVGIDEIREKYPEFADLIEKAREDIDLAHEHDTEVVAEEIEEEIPKPELPEEGPKNGIVSDVMARIFESKHHKKLDRPYEESIYVPDYKEEDAPTDFERDLTLPEEQSGESIRIGDENPKKDNRLEDGNTHKESFAEGERELITGHTERTPERQKYRENKNVFTRKEDGKEKYGLDHSCSSEKKHYDTYVNSDSALEEKSKEFRSEHFAEESGTEENLQRKKRLMSQQECQDSQEYSQGNMNAEKEHIRMEKYDPAEGGFRDGKGNKEEKDKSHIEDSSNGYKEQTEYHSVQTGKDYDDYIIRRQKTDSAVEIVEGKKEYPDTSTTIKEGGSFKSEDIFEPVQSRYGRMDSCSYKYPPSGTETVLSQGQDVSYRKEEDILPYTPFDRHIERVV